MRYLACLLLTVALSSCLTSPDKCVITEPSNPAAETFDPSLGVDLSQMTKTASGVYEQDVVVGNGQELTTPAIIEVYYVAYLPNGTIVDQSLQRSFTFDLRTDTAEGVIEGMIGMKVGGRRLLVVPSNLALGPCGKGPVPPNSTVVYEFELLAINP